MGRAADVAEFLTRSGYGSVRCVVVWVEWCGVGGGPPLWLPILAFLYGGQ